jgi:hypothetical protein
MIANGVRQDALTVLKLSRSLRAGFEYQVWVAEGVVPYNVSGFCDVAGNVGTLLHKLAQHKEGRMHAMLG